MRRAVAELRRRAASFIFTEQDALRLAGAVNRFGHPGPAAARMKRESRLGHVPDAAPVPAPVPVPAHIAPSWAVAASLTAWTKRSTYLLTSRRLVTIREFGRWRRVQAVPLASLAMPYLYDDGTLEFPLRSLAKCVAPGPERYAIVTTYLAASARSASRTFVGLDDADAKTVYEDVDMLLPIAAAAGRPGTGRPGAARESVRR